MPHDVSHGCGTAAIEGGVEVPSGEGSDDGPLTRDSCVVRAYEDPMRAWMSWSSGKDSAWALHLARADPKLEVTGLLTTVTADFDRVAMHAVRRSLLEMQAERLGLELHVVELPRDCPNAVYEERMSAALATARVRGIDAMIFGDLFLEEIRAYRERMLAGTGVKPVFPIWKLPTGPLAREMIDAGTRAHVTCVDPRRLDRGFAGRRFDAAFLDDLPAGVDPCGENGEFHTFVTDGPGFSKPIPVRPGDVVERDGFVFADIVPAGVNGADAA